MGPHFTQIGSPLKKLRSSLHVGAVSVGLICFPFGGPSSDTFLHTLVWFGTQTLGVILVIFKGKSSSAFTLLPLVSYRFQQSSDIAKDTRITAMQNHIRISEPKWNLCWESESVGLKEELLFVHTG